jgi:glutathione S-transferase
VKLYSVNLSPFASRNRLQIYAKGLDVQLLPPPGELKSDAYLAINPLGKIPVLVDGEFMLPESETIAEYLEDRFPEPSLRPGNPQALARARLLSRIVDLYVFPPLIVLFRNASPKQRDQQAVDGALQELEKGLDWLARYLEGTDYAVAKQLSLADCTLVPALFFVNAMLPVFGKPEPFAGASKVGEYYRGVQKNPHVAKVVGELGVALKERMSQRS